MEATNWKKMLLAVTTETKKIQHEYERFFERVEEGQQRLIELQVRRNRHEREVVAKAGK